VNNKRPWGVKCYLGKVLGGSGCKGNGRRRRCSGGGNGGMEEPVARGEGERGRFYRHARSGDEGVTTRDARRGTGPRPARIWRERRRRTGGPWRAPGQYGAVATAHCWADSQVPRGMSAWGRSTSAGVRPGAGCSTDAESGRRTSAARGRRDVAA
jgi:hypothetical protein